MVSAAITFLAASIVLAHSLIALNGMTHRGCNVFRTAHVLLAAGAMGLIVQPLLGGMDTRWAVASLVAGVALCAVARDRATRASAKAFDAWRRISAGGRP